MPFNCLLYDLSLLRQKNNRRGLHEFLTSIFPAGVRQEVFHTVTGIVSIH